VNPIGNSSGFGPQGWGGQPTPFENLWAQNNQQSSMQLLQWAAMTDPLVQSSTRWLAGAVTGNSWGEGHRWAPFTSQSAIDFQKTDMYRMIQGGVAAASMHTNAFGGSVGQMAFGIQQMMGSTGFQLGGSHGGVFQGAGFVTDMTSQYMLDSIRSNFFDPTSGMSNAYASGMNKTDFGELAFALGSRGAFRGERLGEMVQINGRDQFKSHINYLRANNFNTSASEAEAQLAAMGESADITTQALKPNKAAFDKVNQAMRAAGDVIAEFRDVFGPGSSVSKVIEQAERMTGMGFTELGAPQAARQKLADLRNISQITGMDMHTVVSMDESIQMGTAAKMAMMYGGSPGNYARMAAASTMGTWNTAALSSQDRQLGQRLASAQGLHIANFSQDYVMGQTVLDSTRIMGEESIALEALYAADTLGNFDSATAQSIREKVSALGNARSESERSSIRSELSKIMASKGIQSGSLLDSYGGDVSVLMNGMSQRSVQAFANMAAGQTQNRTLTGSLSRVLKGTNMENRMGIGGDKNSFEMLRNLFGSLGSGEIWSLSGKLRDVELGNGNWDSVRSELEKYKDVLDVDATLSQLQTVDKETRAQMGGAYGGLSSGINEAWLQVKNTPEMSNLTSKLDIKRMEDQKFNNTILNKSFGRQRIRKEGVLSLIARGLVGEGTINDDAIIGYLSSKDPKQVSVFDFDSSGGGITADEYRKLSAVLGGTVLADALGVKADDIDGAIAALSTSEGKSKLSNALSASGAAWSVEERSGSRTAISVAKAGAREAAEYTLNETNKAAAALALKGLTAEEREAELKKISKLSDEEYQKYINTEREAAQTAIIGDNTKFDKMMGGLSRGDALITQGIKDAGFLEAIKEKANVRLAELREEYDKESTGKGVFNLAEKDKAEAAKRKIGEIESGLSRLEGGQEYLGRITLVMENEASGDLFRKG
jgi:hypothetical protein